MQAWRRRFLGVDRIPPELSLAEIELFFTAGDALAPLLEDGRREPRHRIALIVQAGFLRLSGGMLDARQRIPADVLRCAAAQTGADAPRIATLRALYGRRRRTLFEHQQEVKAALGFRDVAEPTERALTGRLRKEAQTAGDRETLVLFARVWLHDHGYVAPGRRALEALANAAQDHVMRARREAIRNAVGPLMTDGWASELAGKGPRSGEPLIDWLRRPIGGFGTRDVDDVRARIFELKRLGAERVAPPDLPVERLRAHARRVALRKASTLKRLREPRRTVEIGCWLRLQLMTLTDTVLEQTTRRVGQLWAQARQSVEARAEQELARYRAGMDAICAALEDPAMTPEAFRGTVSAAAAPFRDAGPRPSKAQAIRCEMAREPHRLRALLRQVVALDIETRDAEGLGCAIDALRTCYEGGTDDLGADVVAGLPPAARKAVEQAGAGAARFAAFEVAAAMLLKRGLRNGHASAPHSGAHRAVDDQLMPEDVWGKARGAFSRDNDLPASLEGYVRRFEPALAARLEMLGALVATGEIGLDAGGLRVPRLKAEPVDPTIKRARDALFAEIGPAQLPDLLIDVDRDARFSTALLGRAPRSAQELRVLYCGLLALGTDKSPAAMARMADGVSADQVELAMRQLEEAGRLRAANDAVGSLLLGLPIAARWGSGVMASADMMSLDATWRLWTARLEPRRGTPAVGTYTHVLDQWPIIYDQPILLNQRQAGVAIEGALQQELATLQRLAVDTHGFTHFAMALAKLLGFDLCPRLADLGRRKLYLPKGVPAPAILEPVIERLVLGKTARQGWDGLLRVAASLKGGYGSAAVILDRHGSAARGAPVYECGALLGKFLRSLFLLDYLVNAEFQRGIQRALSQGEAVHPLQRAIMPGRIDARRGRGAQELAAISGGLSLITNTVMAWNAVRMDAIATAHPDRYPAHHLAHIAPAAHRHINMNGVMRFNIERAADLVESGRRKQKAAS